MSDAPAQLRTMSRGDSSDSSPEPWSRTLRLHVWARQLTNRNRDDGTLFLTLSGVVRHTQKAGCCLLCTTGSIS